MSAPISDPWLVVIDMQNIFGSADSDWYAPRFGQIVPVVQRLLPVFGERVVYTRFVAPREPVGAWVDYYRQWPSAVQPADSTTYAIVAAFAELAKETLDCTTFGKWGKDLDEATANSRRLVLVGVATDCCVLSTALAAADAGVQVQIVTDACAGATDPDHQRALDAMALYAPLITLVTAAELLATLSSP